jgi:hypothetical protein
LTFARNLGQTIGVGAYGAALAARMDSVLAERLPAGDGLDAAELLSTPADIRLLPPELKAVVVDAVAQATSVVFVLAVPVALTVLVAGILIPELPLRNWSAHAAGSAGDASPRAPDVLPDGVSASTPVRPVTAVE